MSSTREKLAGKKTKLAVDKEKTEDRPVVLDEYQDGAFYNVDINIIRPNPHQPRHYFDPEALEELTTSVKERGILQPIIIRKDGDEIFLVAGERRLRAAKEAGLTEIPAVITTGNPAEISLIENLQREDLNPIEEAEGYARLMEEFNYTQEEVASRVHKARTTVTETLSLLKLPDQIKKECLRADIPKRALVQISRQKSDDVKISLFNQFKDGLLTSDDIRKATKERVKTIQRTPAAIALDRVFNLFKQLERLDLDKTEEGEKQDLINNLHALRNLIEGLLAKSQST